jgi:hypothetical protein
MFYVKHHDDQVALFNSKCQSVVLANHIKKVLLAPSAPAAAGAGAVISSAAGAVVPSAAAAGGSTSSVDLVLYSADFKAAQPIGLFDKPDGVYANTYLQPRATYVLLSATDPDDDGVREYSAVWKSSKGDESDKLTAALDARTADERKKVGGKGGKGGAAGAKAGK